MLLERRRNGEYSITHSALKGGMIVIPGAKKGKPTQREIDNDTVDFLSTSTNCFKNGSLFIVDKETREAVLDNEDILATHTFEEIKDVLEGNFAKMKSFLKKIVSLPEQDFIIQVAKEIKIDSTSKQKVICEAFGKNKQLVFPDEVE